MRNGNDDVVIVTTNASGGIDVSTDACALRTVSPLNFDEYVGNSNVNEAIHVPRKKRMSLPTDLVTMIPMDDRYLSSTLFGQVKFYDIGKQFGYIIEESTKDEHYFCSTQVRTLPGHDYAPPLSADDRVRYKLVPSSNLSRKGDLLVAGDVYIAPVIAEQDLPNKSSKQALTHHPISKSEECARAEKKMFKFWMDMAVKYCIDYLQGKTADESPPPCPLPQWLTEKLDGTMRIYAGHYPPTSQKNKGYVHPRTGGPTANTNKIIFDAINSCLPENRKVTFGQMYDLFSDLCQFEMPLYIDGKKFDFEKHLLNLLTNDERAEWRRFTINYLKWRYIDAIKNGVHRAIVMVFGRLPNKYWPELHKKALKKALKHILHSENRDAKFDLQITTCPHFSSVYYGTDDADIIKMQRAIKESQGRILEGRVVDHIMQNYNNIAVKNRMEELLGFLRKYPKEVREITKLPSFSEDSVPPSVLSYYHNWKDNIAEYVSRNGNKVDAEDITIQHMLRFVCHRGGLTSKGKKRSAETRAKMSKAKKDKKRAKVVNSR